MGMLFFLFAFRLKNSETRRVTHFARIFQCFKIREKNCIQRCERSELRLHFEWTKLIKNAKNRVFSASFCKPEAYGLTVLPDILNNFQTM